MAAESKWPAPSERQVLGKRFKRVDGPVKVTGRARYSYDINRDRMVYARFVLSPHGRARVVAVDLDAAREIDGVVDARVVTEPGKTADYAGTEIAVVTATTEEVARDAANQVVVEYDVLPHNVVDWNVKEAGDSAQEGAERESGEVDRAFEDAEAFIEVQYGCPIITHCCLEAHGSVVEYTEDDQLLVWPSTQNVSGIGGQYASAVEIPATSVKVNCQHMGGGFGSKFGADLWGAVAAQISRDLKRPVKLMLERDHEIMVAGSRPSAFANVRMAFTEDGEVTAWDSESWGSGGTGTRGGLQLPYIFSRRGRRETAGIPNVRTKHQVIATNTGAARAWRAPNHPQQCFITMSAMEDAAAELGMDPLEFFRANLKHTAQEAVYAEQLDIAADLMGWQDKWIPREDQADTVRTGLGMSMHTWGGGGHNSESRAVIHPDGSVLVQCGTQDLGVGTRTVIGIVAAETFGLMPDAITVEIGENRFPASGGSGGSTTVGGVSGSSRVACTNALNALLEKVAPELGVAADKLEARGGKIQVTGDASKSMAWADACRLMGPTPISVNGQRDAALIDSGVGGVQMAEVEVDVETGVARMKKMVAVQDCGLIVDLTTAESQVYGAMIMGITSALFEERIMDPVTGNCLNPDMEYYRLAGIGDVGELVVHMMQTEAHLSRGVIGLGEPPAISPLAAIGNAVANAAGVRVPVAPFTPDRVLAAIGKGV